jgi:hypothetical protein
MAKKKDETCFEFVRRIWGSCSKEEMDGLLWSCTAFPCASPEIIEKQLLEIKQKSGGNYKKAMVIADEETQEAMKDLSKT